MNTNDPASFKRQIRTHLVVFAILVAVIGLNVAVTFLPLEKPARIGVQIALAALGGGLVLTFFMHLLTETLPTYAILAGTFVLFVALLVLTLVARHDHPELTEYHHPPKPAAPAAAHHVP